MHRTQQNTVHTVFMSGLAVTICFSAGRNLFCLNSMSPADREMALKNEHDTKLLWTTRNLFKYQSLLPSLSFHSLGQRGWNLQPSGSSLSQPQVLACDPLTSCMPATKKIKILKSICIIIWKERAIIIYLLTMYI